MKKIKVSVIVPIYNEENNIGLLSEKLVQILSNYFSYEIIFIDDGSNDNTLENIKKIKKANKNVHYISFTRNFGHQNALKAGLDCTTGECVISMDGDLQHPPELIPDMIEKWQEGFEIIYTIRKNNKSASFLKYKTASLFYKFINMISEVKILQGSSDFRLLDRSVVEEIKSMDEQSPFYRGLIPWTGFRQIGIKYSPNSRYTGKSKYTVRRMVLFALGGITSFSVIPLRLATFLGFGMAFFGFVIGLKAVVEYLFTERTVPGWTSTIMAIVLVGGVQLIILGIIGEYLGRMFIESKKRPHYIIKESSLHKHSDSM
jgi:dolichol-phosphate mannosyltransferase